MKDTNRVMQSYGRCCASADFFDDFYASFLASSPAVREKFVKTDMTAQKQLLRAGILERTPAGKIEFPYDAVKVEFLLQAA